LYFFKLALHVTTTTLTTILFSFFNCSLNGYPEWNRMGRDWWSKKKDTFHKAREKDSKDVAKAKQAALKAQIDRQKRQIRRKMGAINYYLNCAARRRYIAQIVVVDPDEEAAKLEKAKQDEIGKQAAEQARLFKAKQAVESGDWTTKGKKQKQQIQHNTKSSKEDRASRREARKAKMRGGGGGGGGAGKRDRPRKKKSKGDNRR
jgi:hypothetical protein